MQVRGGGETHGDGRGGRVEARRDWAGGFTFEFMLYLVEQIGSRTRRDWGLLYSGAGSPR